MRCPNCRCEVDYRMPTCPYCGTRLQGRTVTGQYGPEKRAPHHGATITTTAYTPRPGTNGRVQQRQPVRQEPRRQTGRTRRPNHERPSGLYYQVIILLLSVLVVLNMLELAAILLV